MTSSNCFDIKQRHKQTQIFEANGYLEIDLNCFALIFEVTPQFKDFNVSNYFGKQELMIDIILRSRPLLCLVFVPMAEFPFLVSISQLTPTAVVTTR